RLRVIFLRVARGPALHPVIRHGPHGIQSMPFTLRGGSNPRPVRLTSLQTSPMWFKNLRIYRLAPSWDLAPDALEDALAKLEFRPGGASDMTTFGWTAPRPESGL